MSTVGRSPFRADMGVGAECMPCTRTASATSQSRLAGIGDAREGGFGDCCERSHQKSLPRMKRVQHTNTFSMRSSATIGLFYRDLGARWLHDDSRWRPSKEKNGRKRVGGFARCAPLNICPDWKGLGMQWDFMAGKTAVSARSWDSHNRSTQTTVSTLHHVANKNNVPRVSPMVSPRACALPPPPRTPEITCTTSPAGRTYHNSAGT